MSHSESKPIKSVAVIGAGPSGVIALDALAQENSFDVIRVFERRDQAGGCWIYKEDPPEPLPSVEKLASRTADLSLTDEFPGDHLDLESLPRYVPKTKRQRFLDTATYRDLESNIDKNTMEFTQEPFPSTPTARAIAKYGKDAPFRHNKDIKEWVQNIYKRKALDDHFEFNTSVELVLKNSTTGKWDIVLRKFGVKKDYLWKESFDAVVVANGRYDVPFVPLIKGLQEFIDLKGKTVIHTKAYRTRESFRNKKVLVIGSSISAMDTVQDIVDVAKVPVVSSIRNPNPHVYFGDHAFAHENVERHPEVEEIVGDTVLFKDGSKVVNVDVIIFGTGYTTSYPFLPRLKRGDFVLKDVYQHIFNIEDPTLAYVGNIAAGLTFKAFEWQAVYVSRYFAGRTELPSKEDQQEWFDKRFKERGDTQKFNLLYPDYKQYFDTIKLLAGNDGPGLKLPDFDEEWEKSFWRGHQRRINYWLEHNHPKSI